MLRGGLAVPHQNLRQKTLLTCEVKPLGERSRMSAFNP
jgi:hypothetical protein